MSNKDETVKKIMGAAKEEFGKKGYSLASTNAIYQAAGVSKGTIFLHFNSKSGLFYELYSSLIKTMMDEMEQMDFGKIPDVFDRMLAVTVWKASYFTSNPLEAKILLEAVSNPPPGLREKMIDHLGTLTKLSVEWFFHEIDMDRFSEDYSKEEVLRFIGVALAGIQQSYVKPGMTMADMESIRDDSMKFLKTVIKGMEKRNEQSI